MPPETTPSNQPIDNWCDAIATPSIAPGGGSAAAIAAGLAAAVVEMVAGLTGSREKYAQVHDQARSVRARAGELRQRLLALAVRDAEALEQFTGALAMPRVSDAAQAVRTEAIRAALREAASVQLDLLEDAVEIADLAVVMAQGGLKGAVGDSATAVFFATAAARSAYWAARSDLHRLETDPEIKARLATAPSRLRDAEAAERVVLQILGDR